MSVVTGTPVAGARPMPKAKAKAGAVALCYSYTCVFSWPFATKNRVSPAALAARKAAASADEAQEAAARAAVSAAAAASAAAVAYAAAGATSPYIFDDDPEDENTDAGGGSRGGGGKWSFRRSFEMLSFGRRKTVGKFNSPVTSFASHGAGAASVADAKAVAQAKAFAAAKAVAEATSPSASPKAERSLQDAEGADDDPFDHPSIKQTGRVQILRQLWTTARDLPPHERVQERSRIMKDVSFWNEFSATAAFHREG